MCYKDKRWQACESKPAISVFRIVGWAYLAFRRMRLLRSRLLPRNDADGWIKIEKVNFKTASIR